ncbi:MAG: O-methyltransferase [Pedobacter sp.]|nr:MAG: O-methyltransferase [Pedobacter sp.]
MDLIHPLAEAYAAEYSSPEDDLLAEISAYTLAHHAHPHMLSGHLQGKLLEMISRMIQPKRILEIGTFTGYSALCLAKGLASDGELHTIELRQEDSSMAQGFFNRSSFRDQIICHTGNALEVIRGLKGEWDLVFIDADKVSYIDYLKLVLPVLSRNGFILADNIFFHGEVLTAEQKSKSGKAIVAFNNFIKACRLTRICSTLFSPKKPSTKVCNASIAALAMKSNNRIELSVLNLFYPLCL